MIALKYIDKQAAVILALKDYIYMKTVIEITPEYVKTREFCAENDLDYPVKHEQKEDSVDDESDNDDIRLLTSRYEMALDYMNWFLPCWNRLSEAHQKILEELYMLDKQRTGALVRLQNELNYSERHIGRMKNKAVEELGCLLYGK